MTKCSKFRIDSFCEHLSLIAASEATMASEVTQPLTLLMWPQLQMFSGAPNLKMIVIIRWIKKENLPFSKCALTAPRERGSLWNLPFIEIPISRSCRMHQAQLWSRYCHKPRRLNLGKNGKLAPNPVFQRRQAAAACRKSHIRMSPLSLGNLSPGRKCLLD